MTDYKLSTSPNYNNNNHKIIIDVPKTNCIYADELIEYISTFVNYDTTTLELICYELLDYYPHRNFTMQIAHQILHLPYDIKITKNETFDVEPVAVEKEEKIEIEEEEETKEAKEELENVIHKTMEKVIHKTIEKVKTNNNGIVLNENTFRYLEEEAELEKEREKAKKLINKTLNVDEWHNSKSKKKNKNKKK